MRGEVTSLNKIVVSSPNSRDLAWTYKWYSGSRPMHTLDSSSIVVIVQFSYVMRFHVECWLLCNDFEFVMIKDDILNGTNLRPSI